MEYERKILTDYLKSTECQEENRRVFNDILKNPKSAEVSGIARKKGNSLFLKQKNHDAQTHKAIFDLYCESVALAPPDSQELALAFGNRSYFLLHIHKYEDSIKDIDRALKITTSDVLKAKLLCRKAECLKRLGSSDFSGTLEMAQKFIDKTDGQDKMKLLQMADAVKALIVSNRRKVEKNINQKDSLPITEDYLSRVSIGYNEKYGRHLLAAKDYEPGDIIFVEKIYASAFKEGSSLSACDYCSKPTWSSIPCSYCIWSMYCSEDCKEKAWNDFHDVECPVISHSKQYSEIAWKYNVIVIRVLIIAIKEAGSIANLKKEVELLDKCTDVSSKGFFKNNQFVNNSFQNIYSLASYVLHEPLIGVARIIPLSLISLTKYSLLKNNFNIEHVDDVFKNEDIMFIGSLMIRIIAVLSANGVGLESDRENQESTGILHFDERRCLSTLYSLLNHSCAPTAHWSHTETNKLFVYALQPIKKNSQIFICYRGSFFSEIQSERQAYYLKKYNFTCDCQACVEAWPPILDINVYDMDRDGKEIDVLNAIYSGKINIKNVEQVKEALQKGCVNKEHVKKLSTIIMQGVHWKKPSFMLWLMITYLQHVFVDIYALKPLSFVICEQ